MLQPRLPPLAAPTPGSGRLPPAASSASRGRTPPSASLDWRGELTNGELAEAGPARSQPEEDGQVPGWPRPRLRAGEGRQVRLPPGGSDLPPSRSARPASPGPAAGPADRAFRQRAAQPPLPPAPLPSGSPAALINTAVSFCASIKAERQV